MQVIHDQHDLFITAQNSFVPGMFSYYQNQNTSQFREPGYSTMCI